VKVAEIFKSTIMLMEDDIARLLYYCFVPHDDCSNFIDRRKIILS